MISFNCLNELLLFFYFGRVLTLWHLICPPNKLAAIFRCGCMYFAVGVLKNTQGHAAQ